MAKLAIIGPGAIGGTVAAWLAQRSDHDVSLCVRTAFDRLEVETPQGLLSVQPRLITAPAQAQPVDWVLIATKAYDVSGTAAWLKGLVGPATSVAILQNGVEHIERFAPFVPVERLLPVVVDCPAERASPGKIVQRRDAWMKVPDSALGQSFRELFVGTRIEVSPTSDFLTAAWMKLCLNCAGAVSAVTLKPNGIVHLPEIAELMQGLVRECAAVGRAMGANLPLNIAETVVDACRGAPRDSVNSLLADRLAGRPMEIDARNGVIVRLGAEKNIPTPLNQAIVALLTAEVAG